MSHLPCSSTEALKAKLAEVPNRRTQSQPLGTALQDHLCDLSRELRPSAILSDFRAVPPPLRCQAATPEAEQLWYYQTIKTASTEKMKVVQSCLFDGRAYLKSRGFLINSNCPCC